MILNRAHILLKDDRKDLRINENARIPWQIKYKQREGIAKLRNISIAGMLVETDTSFNPKDECVFSFDSDPEAGMYIPQLGRLVWHKKKRFSRNKYLSGIKFMEADAKVLKRMRSRVQIGVDQFVKVRHVTTVIGYCLCAVIVGMIGALVWYSNGIYRDVTHCMALNGRNQASLLRLRIAKKRCVYRSQHVRRSVLAIGSTLILSDSVFPARIINGRQRKSQTDKPILLGAQSQTCLS